jgi:hypothetical protein
VRIRNFGFNCCSCTTSNILTFTKLARLTSINLLAKWGPEELLRFFYCCTVRVVLISLVVVARHGSDEKRHLQDRMVQIIIQSSSGDSGQLIEHTIQ